MCVLNVHGARCIVSGSFGPCSDSEPVILTVRSKFSYSFINYEGPLHDEGSLGFSHFSILDIVLEPTLKLINICVMLDAQISFRVIRLSASL